ncbi:MAG TPA: YcxB family protein [Caulobacterales bacterium]|nr:YcxB family protein [Caulobacterales bacterium]
MARTIEYASTRGEIWRWYWRSWRRGLWVTHAVVFCWVSGVVLLLLWSTDLLRPMNVVLALVAGIASIAWMPLFPMIQFKPQTRTLTVDERGISTTIGAKSGVRKWDEIRSVADEEGAIVVVVKTKNAFIIPARAFASDADRADFLNYAKAAFQAAHSTA